METRRIESPEDVLKYAVRIDLEPGYSYQFDGPMRFWSADFARAITTAPALRYEAEKRAASR